MVLTTGQTYFYILCQTVFAITVFKLVHDLIRIRMISRGSSCKELSVLKKEVTEARRLAIMAYNRAAKKDGGQ
jgi:hypothetical protein